MNASRREIPDEVLVVAAILGDLPAFDELARRYRPAVLRLADDIVGPDAAPDMVQDALLIAFRALPSIDEPAKFGAWLRAIARHRAFRFRRQVRRVAAKRVDLDAFLIERLGVFTLPRPVLDETREQVLRALRDVPAEYAEALRLRYLDEMPLRRIAAFLDLPISTVKWRVHRGRKLLKDALARLDPDIR
jgi:RNA polymerase sigma-70 factor (ECF subfamily)